jgi:hypothetical protein
MRNRRTNSILAAALSLVTVALAQNPTDPPSSQRPILTVTGKGVQIYTCQQSSAGPQWVLQSPEATLIDASGNTVGTHSAGPTWKSTDGSAIKGELVQKSPSPDATSIPWLLLKATSPSGSGIMIRVEFIRRSDTHGGLSPTTGCDSKHLNAVSRVAYTATYTFYSATP